MTYPVTSGGMAWKILHWAMCKRVPLPFFLHRKKDVLSQARQRQVS